MSKAIEDVVAELRRQVEREHLTQAHANSYASGEFAAAGASYASHAALVLQGKLQGGDDDSPPAIWPFAADGPPVIWPLGSADWKPESNRSDLLRAAALLVAEIARMDQVAGTESGGG